MRLWVFLVAGAVFATVFSQPARAQLTGSITGFVIDSSGAAVPFAAVIATNLETDAARTVATDAAGRYVVLALPVALYEVRATKVGFRDEVRTGINLAVAQEARVDLSLQVGTIETQVSVTSDAPLVATTTNDISGLVGERQI